MQNREPLSNKAMIIKSLFFIFWHYYQTESETPNKHNANWELPCPNSTVTMIKFKVGH